MSPRVYAPFPPVFWRTSGVSSSRLSPPCEPQSSMRYLPGDKWISYGAHFKVDSHGYLKIILLKISIVFAEPKSVALKKKRIFSLTDIK